MQSAETTIVDIQVEEWLDRERPDRRITFVLGCGHLVQIGIPLSAPVPDELGAARHCDQEHDPDKQPIQLHSNPTTTGGRKWTTLKPKKRRTRRPPQRLSEPAP